VPIPILTCRLAEIIMGRIRPRKLFVLIPAHFLGAIIGTIIFKSIFRTVPLFGKKGILPADIPVDYMMPRILLDCVVVFAFTISINVLPAIVKVNKMSRSFVNLSVLPIFLLSVVDKGTCVFIQFTSSSSVNNA
jgi:glycerol uptake facilitator-like aquaporin